MNEKIPLLIVTGFLGAGKSTLLSRWLVDPEFSGAAILMNELGHIGIDHHVVGTAASVVWLEQGGCICCTIRGALGTALEELLMQRLHRRIDHFTRVVVETTGLAQPGPILDELEANARVSDAYRLEGIVTAVDAVEGERELDAYREAFSQVVVADAIVITKTDLAGAAEVERLEKRIAAVNPWAPRIHSSFGSAEARRVLDELRHAAGGEARRRSVAADSANAVPRTNPAQSLAEVHGPHIRAVTISTEEPLDPATLRSRLETFLEHHGNRVLRIKGLLGVAGQPGPAVIHAVAGVLYPVQLLSRWPEGSSSSVVVITHGVDEEESKAALAHDY